MICFSLIVRDTDRWKQELASLASASGIGVQKEDHRIIQRPATNNDGRASRSGAHYSMRTGRFNEGAGKSRGRTGSKHGTAYQDMLMMMPENEREMWVSNRFKFIRVSTRFLSIMNRFLKDVASSLSITWYQ